MSPTNLVCMGRFWLMSLSTFKALCGSEDMTRCAAWKLRSDGKNKKKISPYQVWAELSVKVEWDSWKSKWFLWILQPNCLIFLLETQGAFVLFLIVLWGSKQPFICWHEIIMKATTRNIFFIISLWAIQGSSVKYWTLKSLNSLKSDWCLKSLDPDV